MLLSDDLTSNLENIKLNGEDVTTFIIRFWRSHRLVLTYLDAIAIGLMSYQLL